MMGIDDSTSTNTMTYERLPERAYARIAENTASVSGQRRKLWHK